MYWRQLRSEPLTLSSSLTLFFAAVTSKNAPGLYPLCQSERLNGHAGLCDSWMRCERQEGMPSSSPRHMSQAHTHPSLPFMMSTCVYRILGEQLNQLSGIAAILRYPLPEIEEKEFDDEESMFV